MQKKSTVIEAEITKKEKEETVEKYGKATNQKGKRTLEEENNRRGVFRILVNERIQYSEDKKGIFETKRSFPRMLIDS